MNTIVFQVYAFFLKKINGGVKIINEKSQLVSLTLITMYTTSYSV